MRSLLRFFAARGCIWTQSLSGRGRCWAKSFGKSCATIDHDRGVAIQAVNLDITDVPIRDLAEKSVGLPVFVDNDANVAALAEHLYGAGKHHIIAVNVDFRFVVAIDPLSGCIDTRRCQHYPKFDVRIFPIRPPT